MQEMVEMSKQTQTMTETPLKWVTYNLKGMTEKVNLYAGPAQFGKMIEGDFKVWLI